MKPVFLVLPSVLWMAPAYLFAAEPSGKPNIVLVLADDLGYGDVHCLNPRRGKIATPHMDRLAAQGMVFTEAHGGSSVCTPTRYGILTGRYAWRTRLQSGVLLGLSPPLIARDRLTVAKLLRSKGYHTACLGKWHLGMELPCKGAGPLKESSAGWDVDYTRRIAHGPITAGFDYYFGISASLDMPPYIWIENDRTVGTASVEKTWIRKGAAHPEFEAIDVLPMLTRKAVEYIRKQAEPARSGTPFFLYLPLTSPHTPILPAKEWQGKSGLSAYGDFVMQTDATVGAVLEALEKHHLTEDTLVIVTSDNGCSPAAGIGELESKGHYPSADFRGAKADIWDGGHHIPFIARWPGTVPPGSRCDRLLCLTDFMATFAELVSAKPPDNAGEDSVSFLPALQGRKAPPRDAIVHHSIEGKFAIRQGEWKLELCPGSGGWSKPGDSEARKLKLPPMQLYDMRADVGERKNLLAEQPEVVDRLTKLLEKYVADGRSTPGPRQPNDVPVLLRK
jgi:arylsulfatase A-like enzyme